MEIHQRRIILDMTPEGEFRTPPNLARPNLARPSLASRIAVGAIIVAVSAGLVATAALAFWVGVMLLPVALVAAGVAYLAVRFQLGRGRPPGRPPTPFGG